MTPADIDAVVDRALRSPVDDAPPWEPPDEDPLDAEPAGPRLVVTPASTIQPSRPTWLWRGWLVRSAVHLLIGRQGAGKSTYVAFVVAALTTGRPLPGDTDRYDPVRCALLSLEEPPDRLVARLTAAGADLDRVVVLGDVEDHDDDGRPFRRAWRLPKDAGALETALVDHRIGFAVVDGLGYAITGDGGYAAVGSALTGLAAVGERTGTAILGLTHPPKAAADPVTAAVGSTAWTSVSRITWILGTDPDEETQRIVQPGKSNFRLPETGLSFTIDTDEQYEVGFVTGLGTSQVDAEALVSPRETAGERTEREEARELVRSLLANGPMDTADLLKATRQAGISDRTVTRARRDLDVVSAAHHDPATGRLAGWRLSLPDHSANPERQPHRGTVGTLAPTRRFTPTSGPECQPGEPGTLDLPDGTESAPTEPFYDRDEF